MHHIGSIFKKIYIAIPAHIIFCLGLIKKVIPANSIKAAEVN